jgi:hypothetical protein
MWPEHLSERYGANLWEAPFTNTTSRLTVSSAWITPRQLVSAVKQYERVGCATWRLGRGRALVDAPEAVCFAFLDALLADNFDAAWACLDPSTQRFSSRRGVLLMHALDPS